MSVTLVPTMLGNNYHSGSELVILKGVKNEPLIIAGYASVDVVDKQNDLITLEAIREASADFMKGDFKNVMITHSNVQVGEVIDNWTDKEGNVLKTGCDDTGFFVVIKMRNDIEKAKEVSRDIRRGKLRSFSIGGQAMSKANRYDPDIGTYKEIDKLELHEVTICEEGINPEAKFEIIKEQKNYKNGDNMSEEINKALEEFNGIVSQLREQVNSTIAKEESDDEMNMAMNDDEDNMSMKDDEDSMSYKAEDDDESESDKMEVDEEAKAESVVYGHNPTGQKRIDGALTGRYESEFSDYVARKAEAVSTLDLSEENLAKAYAQFKAEKEEARMYDVVKENFEARYQAELKMESDAIAKENYDASAEVSALKNEFAELRKSLESNKDVIAKQVEAVNASPTIPEDIILKMNNLHELSWEQVNELVREVKSL
jgi:HK97 family phage prohead protease